MLLIGERINASNSSVAKAIAKRDEEFLANLARAQADAGANFIDINTGTGHGSQQDEMVNMEWLVDIVQAATDRPLAVDSEHPEVIESALRRYRGEKLLINSVTAEPQKLAAVGPMVAESQAYLVALAMGAEGIPDNVKQRLEACETIVTHLTKLGVTLEQIFFDPLVLPISVDASQGLVTLKTIEAIKQQYPDAKTVIGLSNISYGLPNRKLLNRAFLLVAAYAGIDAAILDPLDARMMSFVRVADALTGKDKSCRTYLRTHRRGAIVD